MHILRIRIKEDEISLHKCLADLEQKRQGPEKVKVSQIKAEESL